jgi:opacity protein-like surface antigen
MEEPMRHLYAAAFGLALIGGAAASAQTAQTSNPTPPAIASDHGDSNTSAAPVAGKNSFTESQARDRLEKHGYTQVTGLQQDNQSIWRGKAMKDGKPVDVALDYQGNIVGQ